MGSTPRRQRYQSIVLLLSAFLSLTLGFAVGCGTNANSSQHSGGGSGGGNTLVTLLATSTANDQLTSFGITINSLALTSESGKTATLLSTPLGPEFIHVNGTAEPLATVSVPQGTYTSATISVGGASFGCVGIYPSTGGLVTGYNGYGQVPSDDITISLPAPITLSGTAMGLSLDLLVSQSASLANCSASAAYSISPTFTVTPVSIASMPTNGENGKETGLLGLITAVNVAGNSFTVTAPYDGVTWSVQSGDATEYQGISGLSALTVGIPVDMDLTLQQDGSLLATRVAVQDTDTNQITLYAGPLLQVDYVQVSAQDSQIDPISIVLGTRVAGQLLVNSNYFNFSDAVFQTSSQFANVQTLPFPASFTTSNFVAGQNVSLTAHALTVAGSFPYTPAGSITLQPQTIDGTISAVSSDGDFDIYTVTLAPYDLFPMLATQKGVATPLTQPNTVVVYADSNTQMLNTAPVAVGSVLRFNGLIFNDNGTLRMDCAWVNDGVAE